MIIKKTKEYSAATKQIVARTSDGLTRATWALSSTTTMKYCLASSPKITISQDTTVTPVAELRKYEVEGK